MTFCQCFTGMVPDFFHHCTVVAGQLSRLATFRVPPNLSMRDETVSMRVSYEDPVRLQPVFQTDEKLALVNSLVMKNDPETSSPISEKLQAMRERAGLS